MQGEPETEYFLIPPKERGSVKWILDEGFTGIYRLHARYTLSRVDQVLAARVGGEYAGLLMIQQISPGLGYVYYVAVARGHRHRGIGGALLDRAMEIMGKRGMTEVYAVRDEENIGSEMLFRSRGFREIDPKEFSRRYGWRRSMRLRRRMTMVSGEVLLGREL